MTDAKPERVDQLPGKTVDGQAADIAEFDAEAELASEFMELPL